MIEATVTEDAAMRGIACPACGGPVPAFVKCLNCPACGQFIRALPADLIATGHPTPPRVQLGPQRGLTTRESYASRKEDN